MHKILFLPFDTLPFYTITFYFKNFGALFFSTKDFDQKMSFMYPPQYDFTNYTVDPAPSPAQPPPYNFYFEPKNVIFQPFYFAKRMARLDYDYLGHINVAKISEMGDIQSVMQLVMPIAFANLTQVEAQKRFGCPGAVHAFLILQMAVEYCLHSMANLKWESYLLQGQTQKKDKIPTDFDQRVRANYESQIQQLKSDIENRDLIIDNLTEKYSNVRRERDSLKAQLEGLKKRTTLRKLQPKEFEEEEEEGELHFSLNTNSMPQFNSSSPQVPMPPPKQQMHIDLSPKIYSKSPSSKSNPKTISSKSKPKTNPKHSSKPNSKSNSKNSKKTDSNPKPLKYLKLSSFQV